MKTVVVYVASPDKEINIYASIHSLVRSGTSFDKIKVFSVGGKMDKLKKTKIPIEINAVSNKNHNYFLENKTYIGNVNCERLVYMDADTISLNPINKVWKGVNKDFIGRLCTPIEKNENKKIKDQWRSMLNDFGAKKITPYFNSGFLVFQNKSHKKICKVWEHTMQKVTEKREKNEFLKNSKKRLREQISLSIAISKSNVSYKKMKKHEHVYGWIVPPKSKMLDNKSVVYHTGSRGDRHIKYASSICRSGLVDLVTPTLSGLFSTLYIKLQAYNIAYSIKDSIISRINLC
jgi:hypothetical protein